MAEDFGPDPKYKRVLLKLSGEAFADSLRAAGVDVTTVVEPGTTHGHLNRPEEPAFTVTIDRFTARIRRLA